VKESDLIRAIVEARVRYYRRITNTLLILESICIIALVGTIYLPTKTEPEVMTLLISFTSGLTGALVTIVTQGVQAARKIRSDEELQAELERIGYQESTGQSLPSGIFIQKQQGRDSEHHDQQEKNVKIPFDVHDGGTAK
jgi:hypothetical protein